MQMLERFLFYPLADLPLILITLIIAFTLHEFAHAFFANVFNDPTAKEQGRVTLNPLKHIDPLGMLLILIVGFGWAKPVPVDRSRFKHPRIMGIVVSAAGPLSNLLLAIIAIFIVYLLFGLGWSQIFNSNSAELVIGRFFYYFILLNLFLLLFNLFPLPPLDGYRIIQDLVPEHWRRTMMKHEHYGMIIFLMLVFIPPLSRNILQPFLLFSGTIFAFINDFVASIFGEAVNWQSIFQSIV